MNIALVTTAYRGYQRFIPNWLNFIAEMDTKPTQIVIAMEKTNIDIQSQLTEEAKKLNVDFVTVRHARHMGQMRNLAVKHTNTEWVMYLSVDDKIQPYAIDEFKKYEKDSDWICIRWQSKGLGLKMQTHNGVTPHENYQNRKKTKKGGFIIAQSPYRRWVWEKSPYPDHDYPNAGFIAMAVLNKARFRKTKRPCTVYLRREDSHARTELIKPHNKRKAISEKRKMERMIDQYYRKHKLSNLVS